HPLRVAVARRIRAARTDDRVVVGPVAVGHLGSREVRDAQEQVAHLALETGRLLLEQLLGVAERATLRRERVGARRVAGSSGRADVARKLLDASPELVT